MRIALVFILLFLVFVQHSFAKTTALQKALDKYAKAKSVQADMVKVDEKMALGTKTESKGSLKLEKNKIFISQDGDKKVEFFYADSVLTLVEYPDADFDKDGNRKVTTLRKTVPTFVKSLLNLFSSPKNFNKEFKLESETKDGPSVVADLKPVVKNIKKFSLKIDTKKNEIMEIIFTDDVDTKTSIKFTQTEFNKKFPKETFKYTKLKTDEEVTE